MTYGGALCYFIEQQLAPNKSTVGGLAVWCEGPELILEIRGMTLAFALTNRIEHDDTFKHAL